MEAQPWSMLRAAPFSFQGVSDDTTHNQGAKAAVSAAAPEVAGAREQMTPRPDSRPRTTKVGKLDGRVALITGGDSGIGRAVAVLYAREGADVAIVYLPEEQSDAEVTESAVVAEGRRCLLLPGDVRDNNFATPRFARP